MMKHLKLAAVAFAVLSSLGAQARLADSSNSVGSFAFLAIDSTGTPTSMVVDLGFTLDGNEVVANGFSTNSLLALVSTGHKVQWNFAANTLKIDNGPAQAGNFAYSAPYAFFQANAQVSETRWAVIAATAEGYPNFFLSTGAPSARQLVNQTADANVGLIQGMAVYGASNNARAADGPIVTTQAAGITGANAVVGLTTARSGYLGNGGVFGPGGNWQGNLAWSAYTPEGASNKSFLYAMDDTVDGAVKQNLKFSYSAGVLTAVPEPTTYALMGAGLLALALLRRRSQS